MCRVAGHPTSGMTGYRHGTLHGTIQLQLRNCNQPPLREGKHVSQDEVKSYGVTEGDVLATVLGIHQLTGDRETDVIAAIRQLEELIKDVPLHLRVLYHTLYVLYKPQNEDVWLRVGVATTNEEKPSEPGALRKWHARVKNRAWRRAHPPGLQTELGDGEPEDLPGGGEIEVL